MFKWITAFAIFWALSLTLHAEITNPIPRDTISDNWRPLCEWKLGPIRMAYVDDAYSQPIPIQDTGLFTHYILAFAEINESCNGITLKPSYALSQLVDLKTKNPRVSIILGIGRSSREKFRNMTSKAANREAFATSCKSFIEFYGFDGIDLDWEFPTIDEEGKPNIRYKSDKNNYVELVKDLRKSLGNYKWISFFSFYTADFIDLPKMMEYADFVNVGCYNMGGIPGSDSVLHHSPLYYSVNNPDSWVRKAIQDHINLGIPPSKIILGIPFYGRCAHVAYRNGEIYQGGNIGAHNINQFTDSLELHWDEVAHVPYYSKSDIVGYDSNQQPIYQERIKITFENERSVHDKVIFARGKNLKGVFVWHYSADYDDQGLANAIKEAYQE